MAGRVCQIGEERQCRSPDNGRRVVALIFGDPQAVAELRKLVSDTSIAPEKRREALETLADKHAPDLTRLLRETDRRSNSAPRRPYKACRHLRRPANACRDLEELRAVRRRRTARCAQHVWSPGRPTRWRFVEALERKALPTQDVSAYTARQLQALGDAKLTERMEKVWGTIRETNSDKKAQIAQFKSWLTPDFVKKADLSDGRFVFSRTCQQCHTLFDTGGKVGPDLTGSNRADLVVRC